MTRKWRKIKFLMKIYNKKDKKYSKNENCNCHKNVTKMTRKWLETWCIDFPLFLVGTADVYGQEGLHPTLPLCMHSGNNPQIYRHLNRSPVPPYRHTSDTSDSLYSDTYSTKNVYSSRKKYRTPNQRSEILFQMSPKWHQNDT